MDRETLYFEDPDDAMRMLGFPVLPYWTLELDADIPFNEDE